MRIIPLLTLLLSQNSHALYEAHEWGTFTSLVGSNGITQNGLYHEDEALPPFVHGFGVTQAQLPRPPSFPLPPQFPCHNKGCFPDEFFETQVITQKMETPVIYFYSDQERSVDVNVRFPEGVVTETFPAPVATSPSTGSIREAANGNTTFHVDVLAQNHDKIPEVDPANIYSHARNVASNIVRSGSEREKFIFYRGIGRFQPRLGIRSEKGELRMNIREADLPLAAFLVHVDERRDGQLMPLNLEPGENTVDALSIRALRLHTNNARKRDIRRGPQMRETLVAALQVAGLRPDEAAAMINTWEHGYLGVPGLRLLYVLPRAEVDQVLPLTISPAPEKVERVFVGRIEVMLDTDEEALVSRILTERDAFRAGSLGRFAEPMLRRALEVYTRDSFGSPDYTVLERLNRLIREAAKASE